MTTNLKIILAVSVALFLASLTDTGSAIAWGFLKPLSAILFIVFFIGQLLHKEVVEYEEECRTRLNHSKSGQTVLLASKPADAGPAPRQNPRVLVAAH